MAEVSPKDGKPRSTAMHEEPVLVGGIPFRCTSLERAARWLLDLAMSRPAGVPVRLANAYCVALAQKDSDYRAVLRGTGVNLPDGAPVVWFMRRSSRGLSAGRVRGPSFFRLVLALSEGTPVAHYFLGSTPDVLGRLIDEIHDDHPHLNVAGAFAPPFAPVDEPWLDDVAARVHRARPDLVWVGMGTPKQDFVAVGLAARLSIPCVGVGAAFDFVAGAVPEAPMWMQRTGVEWVFRLVSEPRRLWKRYLVGNTMFLAAAIRGLRARAENES